MLSRFIALVFLTLLLEIIFLGVILSSFLGVAPGGFVVVVTASFLTILELLILSIFNRIIISYLSSPLFVWDLLDPSIFGGLLPSDAAAFPFACKVPNFS